MGYDFSRYGTATLSSGVATMSSLAQLRLKDTEKQRWCRCNGARL